MYRPKPDNWGEMTLLQQMQFAHDYEWASTDVMRELIRDARDALASNLYVPLPPTGPQVRSTQGDTT